MDFLWDNLEATHREKLEVILVPSSLEVQHIFPIPQPPYPVDMLAQTKFRKNGRSPHLVANPGIFTLNDVSVAFMNADIVYGMCRNVVDRVK